MSVCVLFFLPSSLGFRGTKSAYPCPPVRHTFGFISITQVLATESNVCLCSILWPSSLGFRGTKSVYPCPPVRHTFGFISITQVLLT